MGSSSSTTHHIVRNENVGTAATCVIYQKQDQSLLVDTRALYFQKQESRKVKKPLTKLAFHENSGEISLTKADSFYII